MPSASKPRWQQASALVSLSAGGAITGFSFVPSAPAQPLSPTSTQIRLLALQQAARPALADDAMLRSAIVNVANYYLLTASLAALGPFYPTNTFQVGGFSDSLAWEVAPFGVKVCTLEPGGIRTN